MNKRDDNNLRNSTHIEISSPFSAGEFGEVYSDNRESWLRDEKKLHFSLLD